MAQQQQQQQPTMFISTTAEIPGAKIVRHLGVVYGATVRARGVGGDCIAGCQSCFGGEVGAYTAIAIDGRNEAVSRMLADAQTRGANAVVGLKFDTENMGGKGASTNATVAYGTAVLVEFN
jgi:uncharacterized protein YbjQ (UPF0145 family)